MSKDKYFEPPCIVFKELGALLTTAVYCKSKDGKEPVITGTAPTIIVTRIVPFTDRVLLSIDEKPDAHGVGRHLQFQLTVEAAEWLGHALLNPQPAEKGLTFESSLNGTPGKAMD